MITGINKSKSLVKCVLCDFNCKLDAKKFNLKQKWSQHKCWCECIKQMK